MYKKIVNKGHLDFCFLSVRLDFEDSETNIEIDIVLFKHIIKKAVQSLHGLAGASRPFDVLKYDPVDRSAILRIQDQFRVKFWSSLTMYGSYNNRACAFRVLQVSSHLMALSDNSRASDIQTVGT